MPSLSTVSVRYAWADSIVDSEWITITLPTECIYEAPPPPKQLLITGIRATVKDIIETKGLLTKEGRE